MNVELPRRELDLSSAIADADIRCLLMVLAHMTGDERWLEEPYKPKRDVRLIPDPDARRQVLWTTPCSLFGFGARDPA